MKHSIMPTSVTTLSQPKLRLVWPFLFLLCLHLPSAPSSHPFSLPILCRWTTTSKWTAQIAEPRGHQHFTESTLSSSLSFPWNKLVQVRFYVLNRSCDSILRLSFARNTMPAAKDKHQRLLGIFFCVFQPEGRQLLEAFKTAERKLF